MEIIERLDHEGFTAYLKKYSNTICGRHPIGVFLGAIKVSKKGISFVKNISKMPIFQNCCEKRDERLCF